MEKNNNSAWTNYGDVNPLEHGGIFVKKDEAENAFKGCYFIEKVDKIPDNDKFLISSLYVDVNDTWINKDEVVSCCDTPKNDELMYAIDCTSYYNSANFGEEIILDTEEEVKDYLQERGITLEG